MAAGARLDSDTEGTATSQGHELACRGGAGARPGLKCQYRPCERRWWRARGGACDDEAGCAAGVRAFEPPRGYEHPQAWLGRCGRRRTYLRDVKAAQGDRESARHRSRLDRHWRPRATGAHQEPSRGSRDLCQQVCHRASQRLHVLPRVVPLYRHPHQLPAIPLDDGHLHPVLLVQPALQRRRIARWQRERLSWPRNVIRSGICRLA